MQEMTSEQFLLKQLQKGKFAQLVKELTAHLLYNSRSHYWLTGVRHWSPFRANDPYPETNDSNPPLVSCPIHIPTPLFL
jgi:hypothetical protein